MNRMNRRDREPARPETLAAGALCKVDRCGCGAIHVTTGTVTTRLSPRAFESLCDTLFEALARLLVQEEGRGRRPC